MTVVIWGRTRRRLLRALLVLYPPAMAFTLVYGGEHYVIDVLVGWAYVVVVLVVVSALERASLRRAGGAACAVPPEPAAERPINRHRRAGVG